VTGNTTCVWEAPTLGDLEAVFSKAAVTVGSITKVEEMAASAET
jgi:hypothetical protein